MNVAIQRATAPPRRPTVRLADGTHRIALRLGHCLDPSVGPILLDIAVITGLIDTAVRLLDRALPD